MWPSTASSEWVSSAIRSVYIFTWKKKRRDSMRFVLIGFDRMQVLIQTMRIPLWNSNSCQDMSSEKNRATHDAPSHFSPLNVLSSSCSSFFYPIFTPKNEEKKFPCSKNCVPFTRFKRRDSIDAFIPPCFIQRLSPPVVTSVRSAFGRLLAAPHSGCTTLPLWRNSPGAWNGTVTPPPNRRWHICLS